MREGADCSQGVAPYCDLFDAPDAGDAAAGFLAPLVAEGQTLLDIGAGTGGTAFALAERGVRVTALEPDPQMMAALLVRLAARRDIAERVTPVPRAAGFAFGERFHRCTCIAVLHLLQDAEQEALLRYARAMLAGGGLFVLDVPVVSATRADKPWEVVATRRLGRLQVAHHLATQHQGDGRWTTHWKFLRTLDGQALEPVEHVFHWRPLAPERVDALLDSATFEVLERHGSLEREPFAAGRSANLVVVAR
jgi:SAM-dependent methyltransferase